MDCGRLETTFHTEHAVPRARGHRSNSCTFHVAARQPLAASGPLLLQGTRRRLRPRLRRDRPLIWSDDLLYCYGAAHSQDRTAMPLDHTLGPGAVCGPYKTRANAPNRYTKGLSRWSRGCQFLHQ